MTMYESASRLNDDLKQLFNSVPIEQFTLTQRETILNLIIRFGAVAKFRCRSNTAYDNFVNATFKDIATTKREKRDESDEYETLHATINTEVRI